ncbi:MAG: tRNA lysidine(34) synthetase TilS [Porticoccaceae bacterium]
MSKKTAINSALDHWQESFESAPQILVAVSGGLDSMLLLTLMAERVNPERITAVHINHGLSDNADQWQAQVAQYCQQLGVALEVEKVTLVNSGEGLEAEARNARYAVFERLLMANGLLFLGHHADDQAETLLYRLMRGSGAKGLSGMPVKRALGKGYLIRPFLNCAKSDLQNEAQIRNLNWIEDESNLDNRFDRNYLRNAIIPQMAQRWPDYTQSFGRTAALNLESDQLAKELAVIDLQSLDLKAERAGWSISIEALLMLSALRQKNILRYWSELQGLVPPGITIIDEVLTSVLSARQDACPEVIWQSQRWSRFKDRLYLQKCNNQEFKAEQIFSWDMQNPLNLGKGHHLRVAKQLGQGIKPTVEQVEVRFRQGGERCKPAGRGHSNSLKKLLLEYELVPWLRDRVPLFYVGEQLIAVGDLWVCEDWLASSEEIGQMIYWQVDSV